MELMVIAIAYGGGGGRDSAAARRPHRRLPVRQRSARTVDERGPRGNQDGGPTARRSPELRPRAGRAYATGLIGFSKLKPPSSPYSVVA
jgi:hypothetical protein